MEDDWITNFFDKCRIVSEEEMQALWAKVLAGEANSPGTYSKRTIGLLASLDKKEAHVFTNVCGFTWRMPEPWPLIYDTQEQIYKDQGINFGALRHLAHIGLIDFENLAGFIRTHIPKQWLFNYYGNPLILSFAKDKDNKLESGKVMLTRAGEQLLPICGAKPVDGFFDYYSCEVGQRGIGSSLAISQNSTWHRL
jgi:hypothetical protein